MSHNIPYAKDTNDLILQLKEMKTRRVYLSHSPKQEQGARRFADLLRGEGFTVIVAADARPHKDAIRDRADEFVVGKIIEGCDTTVVYEEG
jgi:hypothetical protein